MIYFHSCIHGDLSGLEAILKLGASVNWQEKYPPITRQTGLHIAAYYNHKDLVEFLLTQDGIDVNMTDWAHRTPLMLAVERNHVDIVRRLIRVEGIDYQQKCTSGYTALAIARKMKHTEIVKVLKEAIREYNKK